MGVLGVIGKGYTLGVADRGLLKCNGIDEGSI